MEFYKQIFVCSNFENMKQTSITACKIIIKPINDNWNVFSNKKNLRNINICLFRVKRQDIWYG
jgi:hypothetical protein